MFEDEFEVILKQFLNNINILQNLKSYSKFSLNIFRTELKYVYSNFEVIEKKFILSQLFLEQNQCKFRLFVLHGLKVHRYKKKVPGHSF